jgi:hypothetical protein
MDSRKVSDVVYMAILFQIEAALINELDGQAVLQDAFRIFASQTNKHVDIDIDDGVVSMQLESNGYTVSCDIKLDNVKYTME